MLRFGDCRGVQPLRTGRLVYSLLIVQICATCRQGVAQIGRSGVERFATLWGIHGEFGTTWVSKPAFFNTLVYFQRAHPPFVFYFTATFISFSYCLIRARSPVEIQSLLIPYILLFCFFRRALFLLDGAISGPVVLLSGFHRLLSPGVGLT